MSASHSSEHDSSLLRGPWARRGFAVCFACALILGTVGYKRYDSAMHPMDALYHTAQLFAMHGPHLEHPVPWQLQWGRWLAAATTVLAGVKFFGRMWHEESRARRMRLIRKHTIVCGMGSKGRAVIRHLRERGVPVVAIETSPTPDAIAACHAMETHLITGDATSPEVLQTARIGEASELIAICPDDSTNCEIAAHVCRLARSRRHDPVRCRIQVGDAETRHTLQKILCQSRHSQGTVVRFFDCFDPEARQLLIHGLPLDHAGVSADEPRQVHLVVLGLGRMGRALVLRAAQAGIFANGKRLKISILDRRVDVHRDELFFRHPRIAGVCDISFYTAEAASPQTRELLSEWCSDTQSITSIAICFESEQRALEIAMQLSHVPGARNVPVAVRMSGQSGIARLLGEAGAGGLGGISIHPFGMEERAGEMGALGDDSGELFARKIHSAYLKMRRAEAAGDDARLEKLATDDAMKEWDDLSEDFRESNRQQHAHIFVKVRAVNCDVASEDDTRPALEEFTENEVELLSELEHRRWMAEKIIAGWRHAPGPKDLQQRTNPALIPWCDLLPEVKEYDRKAVRPIPKLLKSVGKKVCRRG